MIISGAWNDIVPMKRKSLAFIFEILALDLSYGLLDFALLLMLDLSYGMLDFAALLMLGLSSLA